MLCHCVCIYGEGTDRLHSGYMIGICKGCKGKPDGCEAVQCLIRQRAACAHAMCIAYILTLGS